MHRVQLFMQAMMQTLQKKRQRQQGNITWKCSHICNLFKSFNFFSSKKTYWVGWLPWNVQLEETVLFYYGATVVIQKYRAQQKYSSINKMVFSDLCRIKQNEDYLFVHCICQR